ncbi:MAG: SgcJ/EcaC family oxidoreductase [Acidobacteriota bacterium]
MHRAILPCACIFVLSLTACTQAPLPPAPDTRAADEKVLRDLDASSLAAWKSKDADKVAAFYADDATVVLPNAPAIRGKEAIRSGLKDAFTDPNFKLDFSATGAEAGLGSDIGYVKGTYAVTASDAKTKAPMLEKGNYLIVYKKQADGSWKILNDFASPEAPAARAAK